MVEDGEDGMEMERKGREMMMVDDGRGNEER